MAKKKEEEAPKGSPAWMATFSDLMNLLMCFFVLLFSMSSVDESKVEALIKSLADTFSIFDGGGSSFEEGVLISSGSTQLSYLDEYFNQSGQTDDGDKNENVNNGSGNQGNESGNGNNNGGAENNNQSGNTGETTGDKTQGGGESQQDKDKYSSGLIYEDIMSEANKYNIGDFIDVKVDSKAYKYVEINISGAILFDSSKAELKDDAISVLSKVVDILKTYKGYKIEIIGHTDNIPLNPQSKYGNNDILSSARALAVGEYMAETKLMGWTNIYCIGRGEHDPIKDNSTAEGRAANRRVEIRLYNNKAE